MKYSILKWFNILLLLMLSSHSIGQNLSLDILNMCANSTSCNPFVNEYICHDAVLRATHGSPAFYLPSTNTTREIQLEAVIGSGGISYSEGFTLGYHFHAGKTYTVKINHMGMPQAGAVLYPQLIANLTNSPPRFDDGCSLGYLTSINVLAQYQFTVSSTSTTSSFDFTPSQDIFYLWLRSDPVQFQQAGLLIFSIEIVDHSVSTPPPPPPPTYGCNASLNFCDINWSGSIDVRITNPYTINCDAFRDVSDFGPAGYPLWRRFCAPKIILAPGFIASAYDPSGEIRKFRALPSAAPCNQSLTFRVAVTDTVKAIRRDIKMDQQLPDNILIYPSPSKGLVKITGNKSELSNTEITVIDQSGRIVYQLENKSENYVVELNLQHLSNGVYFIKINAPGKVTIRKVIISK